MWGAVFPGQGSQSIGMGRFFFDNFQEARELFEEASDAAGISFKKLCFEGPESDLMLTENTQPALVLVSTVSFRVIRSVTEVPITATAGHSVGEYSACVAAEAIPFAQAIRAVQVRGQAMQRAVPVGEGAMFAVLGPSDEQVLELCAWVQKESGLSPVEAANFNAPGQVVISGSSQALAWLKENIAQFKSAQAAPLGKIRLIPLAVSAPFHCSMMKPAEEEMREVLKSIAFQRARFPVVQNFSATETKDPQRLREELIRQISGSVRWTQCMQRLQSLGINHLIEFGSGKVLSGLAKKIDSDAFSTLNINSLDELKTFEKIASDVLQNGFEKRS
jgi:[acyl-carrier-protein] S-malonyltransferase